MAKSLTFISIFFCLTSLNTYYAYSQRLYQSGNYHKTTFLDAQVSTSRFEVGISERVSERQLIGMYLSFFWEVPLETTTDEEFAIEARSKLYLKNQMGEWFIAPSIGIINLSDSLEGIVSASVGYDHLFSVSLFTNTTRFRIGFFVEGAVLSNSNGFASFGIGVGF